MLHAKSAEVSISENLTFQFAFLYFILDPELIFDKMKLHEDGLHDVIDVFPRDFNIKQFKPDMSGMLASIDSKCKKQARTANMLQKNR